MHAPRIIRVVASFGLLAAPLFGENGHAAWLRYAPRLAHGEIPATIVTLGDAPEIVSARAELARGLKSMFKRTLREQSTLPAEDAFVLGAFEWLAREAPQLAISGSGLEDSFHLKAVTAGGHRYTVISAPNPRGVLYGTFALLRRLNLGESITALDDDEHPYAPVRWVNQWDNLDGSIERGYGGRSIFFDKDSARTDLSQASEYARLLASIGINGCAINNVNANPRVLAPEFIPQLTRIAGVFRPWGVRLVLSVDFGSPQSIGGLGTFDPADPRVAAWWRDKVNALYQAIPDLGGFVLKADSEGRVGPSAYHRTHADAANVVAHAIQPNGGLLFYRGFVYDHHMDWRNLKNDRARAAYDNFQPLDGQFDDNAVIQIKHGPIDFQVREPVSPLFAALRKTNQAIELQITQEYFGQAHHLVFLVPMWKEALDFDLHARGPGTPVKALVAGKVFRRPVGGFVGVANVGLDENWTGNHLSQANLYGFGRLAWNPDLSARDIAQEWTQMTFSSNPALVQTISEMLLVSWRNFENYTGPLGLQTLTDITGTHYGPAVEASERNGWGQWHRADEKGVGMDRTTATGTGFLGQYPHEVEYFFTSLKTCPDDLLLFMHHVPYTYVLHSGKTVIQSIYDLHYDGASAAARYVTQWQSLAGLVDEGRYSNILQQLEYQAGHAEVWRDAISTWFLHESGIPDERGRVGNYPGRVEAESMQLSGYVPTPVDPWETASGGQAITCATGTCTASFTFHDAPGWYDIRVQYFDLPAGQSRFRVFLGKQLIDSWQANEHFAARKLDGASSTRRTIPSVALRPGDTISIEGTPDQNDPAALDYVAILKARD